MKKEMKIRRDLFLHLNAVKIRLAEVMIARVFSFHPYVHNLFTITADRFT